SFWMLQGGAETYATDPASAIETTSSRDPNPTRGRAAYTCHVLETIRRLDVVIRSIRIALRGLGRTPAFTAAALTILGLGIGTAVAMFTVFRAVVYQRIPVPSPDRVAVISTYKDPAVEFGLVKSDIKVIRRQARTIREIGGYAHWGTSQGPLVDGDRTLTLGRVVIVGAFFEALGARAAVGRLLTADDDVLGAAPALVISY